MEVEILLEDIENKDLVLPEFQRDFVWKADDIKKYIQFVYEIVKSNPHYFSKNFRKF
jgi:uncharacterized protein with ParB-like and HNH nuclease domain